MKETFPIAKVFQDKNYSDDDHILVAGYNKDLIAALPPGSVIIDPSIKIINNAISTFENYSFQARDLEVFNLNRKFTKILSLNTLHLVKDLTKTFTSIQNHLKEEALIYFPLSPNKLIEQFLEDKDIISSKEKIIFQKRAREDVEAAVLQAPFTNIIIEEKEESITFTSEEDLLSYLTTQIETLTTLKDQELRSVTKELMAKLRPDQDKVLTLSAPWILLILSNESTLV